MALGYAERQDDIIRMQCKIFGNDLPRLLKYVIYCRCYEELSAKVKFDGVECKNVDELEQQCAKLLDDFGIFEKLELDVVSHVIEDYTPYIKPVKRYQGMKPKYLCNMVNNLLKLGYSNKSVTFIDAFGGSGTMTLNVNKKLVSKMKYNDTGRFHRRLIFLQNFKQIYKTSLTFIKIELTWTHTKKYDGGECRVKLGMRGMHGVVFLLGIGLLYDGFILNGTRVRPNKQIASICIMMACFGLRLGDIMSLKMSCFTKLDDGYKLKLIRKHDGSVKEYEVPSECFSIVRGYAIMMGRCDDDFLFTITKRQVQRHVTKVFSCMKLNKFYSSSSYTKCHGLYDVYDVELARGLFTVTKSYLEKEIKRGAELAGLKEIRVHDLRHSHASFLISQGVDIATISNRLGHEKISTTLNTYSHMFESSAAGVADMLDNIYYSEED